LENLEVYVDMEIILQPSQTQQVEETLQQSQTQQAPQKMIFKVPKVIVTVREVVQRLWAPMIIRLPLIR
jgi:hypothetical protein